MKASEYKLALREGRTLEMSKTMEDGGSVPICRINGTKVSCKIFESVDSHLPFMERKKDCFITQSFHRNGKLFYKHSYCLSKS